jgi:hypothetical protein
MRSRVLLLCAVVIATIGVWSTAIAQNPPKTPTETARAFYTLMREKKYREAFALSIYQPAIQGLTAEEFEDLRPEFDKVAAAITEQLPGKDVDVGGEQISGDVATVFLKTLGPDGKETVKPTTLIKVSNAWIVGDQKDLELVKKAGKKFFFEARLNAHHDDVQDMMTRITLAQVLYSQSHNGAFGNMAELITAGVVPKDIEGTESTGYRFQVNRSGDGKSWYATAEPVQYGRTGRLSFYLDASGVRSGDAGGKPLNVKTN